MAPSAIIATVGALVIFGALTTRLDVPAAEAQAQRDAMSLISLAGPLVSAERYCPQDFGRDEVQRRLRTLATFGDGLDVTLTWSDTDEKVRVEVSGPGVHAQGFVTPDQLKDVDRDQLCKAIS